MLGKAPSPRRRKELRGSFISIARSSPSTPRSSRGSRAEISDIVPQPGAGPRRIARRIPATVLLAATSIIVAVLVALPLGARRDAAREGRGLRVGFAAMLSLSIPNFLLGPLLVLLFSVQLGLLPVSGYGAGRPAGAARRHARTGMAAPF